MSDMSHSTPVNFVLQEHRVSQHLYATSIESMLRAQLSELTVPADEAIAVVIVCPVLANPADPESTIFVFPMSSVEDAIEVILPWAQKFQSVHLVLPGLTMLFTFNWVDLETYVALTESPSDYGLDAELIVDKIKFQQKQEEDEEASTFS